MLGASRHDRQSPMTTARDNQLLLRLKGCRTSSRRVGRIGRPHKGGVGTVSWDAAFTRTVMLHDSSRWVLRLRLASLRFLLSDAFRRIRSTRSINSTPAMRRIPSSGTTPIIRSIRSTSTIQRIRERKERGHSGFLRHLSGRPLGSSRFNAAIPKRPLRFPS